MSSPPTRYLWQCERVSPIARRHPWNRQTVKVALLLWYHYLVICQWRNHYILCFVAFAKNPAEFSEQNLGATPLTNRTSKVPSFRGVISPGIYTMPLYNYIKRGKKNQFGSTSMQAWNEGKLHKKRDRGKNLKKSAKKCWQEGGSVVLYSSTKCGTKEWLLRAADEVKRKNQYEDVKIRAEAERLMRDHTFEKNEELQKRAWQKPLLWYNK